MKADDNRAEAARHLRYFLQKEVAYFFVIPPDFLSNLLDYWCPAGKTAQLASPMTSDEIQKALFSLSSGKASSPDRITKEFYVVV